MSLQIVSLLATFGAYGLGRWLSRLCQLPSFGVTLDFDFVLVFAVNQPLILGLEHHIHPLFFALIAAPGINRLAVFLLSNFCLGKVLVADMTCPLPSGLESELNPFQPALATEPAIKHVAVFDEDDSVQGFMMYMVEFVVFG